MRKIWILLAVAAGALWAQDQADPPSRVARLSYLSGTVSFRPDNVEEWAAATLNYPLTTGDRLWTDERSHAELHIGSTAIRLADHTAVTIINLDDRIAQISVSQGFVHVRVRRLEQDESIEVDTPNGAISLLQPGDYRIDVNPDRDTSITVRDGQAEAAGGGQAFPVEAGQTGVLSGTDEIAAEIVAARAPDAWDNWCQSRDDGEGRAMEEEARYVPEEMIGAEDLAGQGDWQNDSEYGPVWTPRSVAADWAPYRFGHWAYVMPWGWTWIDDAPWGFAPFHYGRWAQRGGRWFWAPGARVGRPVYAPALVAFVGGSRFGAAIAIGGGGFAAWVPLGPREVYRPYYRVSDRYIRNVNMRHVTNINFNVTNVTYVNRTHITVVRHDDFTGARGVGRAYVRVSPQAIGQFERMDRVDFQPRRDFPRGVRVSSPPRNIVESTVIVRHAPPPAAGASLRIRIAAPVRPRIEERKGPAPPGDRWRPENQPRPERPPQRNEPPVIEQRRTPPVIEQRPHTDQPQQRTEPRTAPRTEERPHVEKQDKPAEKKEKKDDRK